MTKTIRSGCLPVLVTLLVNLFSINALAATDTIADAARNEDWGAVIELMEAGSEIDAPDQDGMRALHWAVRADHIEAVELLLKAGADPSSRSHLEITPLYLAAFNGNRPVIERLIEAGADPNQVDRTGETILMVAVQSGDAGAVDALLEHGANVDARDPMYGQTALSWAARDGNAGVVRTLLAYDANVQVRTRTGEPPDPRLPCINRTGCGSHGIGIVRGGLPERGSRTPIPGAMTPLMFAAREGAVDAARLLMDAGSDVNAVDANGIGPLLLAISNNHVELARILLDSGAEINAVDWYGRTPLWAAVEMRNVDLHYVTFEHMIDSTDRQRMFDLIATLLERGAEPNVRIQEVPPLRRWLYLLGGSLAWVDFTGQTPFLLASLSGDVATMRLLLENGADPHIPTFEGTTPLMAAAGVNWVVNQTFTEWDSLLDAVQLCLDLGMDPNSVNSMGLTALMGAANRGSDDVIRLLVERGARLDVRDNEGRTPLAWAEGVFLATHAPEAKPSSIALIRELMTDSTAQVGTAQE